MAKQKRKYAEHIVINTLTGRLECRRCGGQEEYNERLPLPINEAVKLGEAFKHRHLECEETEAGRALIEINKRRCAEWDAKHKGAGDGAGRTEG